MLSDAMAISEVVFVGDAPEYTMKRCFCDLGPFIMAVHSHANVPTDSSIDLHSRKEAAAAS